MWALGIEPLEEQSVLLTTEPCTLGYFKNNPRHATSSKILPYTLLRKRVSLFQHNRKTAVPPEELLVSRTLQSYCLVTSQGGGTMGQFCRDGAPTMNQLLQLPLSLVSGCTRCSGLDITESPES